MVHGLHFCQQFSKAFNIVLVLISTISYFCTVLKSICGTMNLALHLYCVAAVPNLASAAGWLTISQLL